MEKNSARFGWTLALAGFLLLLAIGKLDLLIVLLPMATLVACGFLWIVHRHQNVTHGLK